MFLIQFFMLFHMVACILFSMVALLPLISKILIGCWRKSTDQKMVEKATMESKTEATKSIRNRFRKWCQKCLYILFGATYRKNKQCWWRSIAFGNTLYSEHFAIATTIRIKIIDMACQEITIRRKNWIFCALSNRPVSASQCLGVILGAMISTSGAE